MKSAIKIFLLPITVSLLACQQDPPPSNGNNGTLPAQYHIRGKINGELYSQTITAGFHGDGFFGFSEETWAGESSWAISFSDEILPGITYTTIDDEGFEDVLILYGNTSQETSYFCNSGTFQLQTLDTVQHIAEGIFEGTFTSTGEDEETLIITEGHFIAPYVE